MAKIWDKGYSIDETLEAFTVGQDYLLDRRLITADAVASIAHARMLHSIGVLTEADLSALTQGLRELVDEALSVGIEIPREYEDSHTTLESRLTERLGEAGKRIHTGRSRNDQVVTSTRLFAREGLLSVRWSLVQTVKELRDLADREAATPMVGRTHLQPAMPSTVGLWAASHAELLLDADVPLRAALELIDRSALGAAAGYGVPLPLDREMVAGLLGFSSLQNNVLATVSSRGQVELAVLNALDGIGIALSRLASDLILFALPEFGYFTLPDRLTTGSSIMPQKKNPDGLELLRGSSGVLSGYADRVRAIVRSLHAGFNRDTQETKEPLIRGIDLSIAMLQVARASISSLEVHPDRLVAGFDRGVLATDRALELVAEGATFRDAYRQVAAELREAPAEELKLDSESLRTIVAKRTATGAPGNLNLGSITASVAAVEDELEAARVRIDGALSSLLGKSIALYPGTPDD